MRPSWVNPWSTAVAFCRFCTVMAGSSRWRSCAVDHQCGVAAAVEWLVVRAENRSRAGALDDHPHRPRPDGGSERDRHRAAGRLRGGALDGLPTAGPEGGHRERLRSYGRRSHVATELQRQRPAGECGAVVVQPWPWYVDGRSEPPGQSRGLARWWYEQVLEQAGRRDGWTREIVDPGRIGAVLDHAPARPFRSQVHREVCQGDAGGLRFGEPVARSRGRLAVDGVGCKHRGKLLARE